MVIGVLRQLLGVRLPKMLTSSYKGIAIIIYAIPSSSLYVDPYGTIKWRQMPRARKPITPSSSNDELHMV